MRGKLGFRGTPLGKKVAAESNRCGPEYLINANPPLDNIKVSGQLYIGNTKALVRAPFGDKIRLYRRKSE